MYLYLNKQSMNLMNRVPSVWRLSGFLDDLYVLSRWPPPVIGLIHLTLEYEHQWTTLHITNMIKTLKPFCMPRDFILVI